MPADADARRHCRRCCHTYGLRRCCYDSERVRRCCCHQRLSRLLRYFARAAMPRLRCHVDTPLRVTQHAAAVADDATMPAPRRHSHDAYTLDSQPLITFHAAVTPTPPLSPPLLFIADIHTMPIAAATPMFVIITLPPTLVTINELVPHSCASHRYLPSTAPPHATMPCRCVHAYHAPAASRYGAQEPCVILPVSEEEEEVFHAVVG